jgi:predicted acylesterase/phospholipase RssA
LRLVNSFESQYPSDVGIRGKKKPALVLSGGGIKAAAFHAGVCLALKEKGFRFAGGTKDEVDHHHHDHRTIATYVGSSAGAIVTSFLASG